MTTGMLVTAIQHEFDKKLQAKTGWGRTEASALLRSAITLVLSRALDDAEDQAPPL